MFLSWSIGLQILWAKNRVKIKLMKTGCLLNFIAKYLLLGNALTNAKNKLSFE